MKKNEADLIVLAISEYLKFEKQKRAWKRENKILERNLREMGLAKRALHFTVQLRDEEIEKLKQELKLCNDLSRSRLNDIQCLQSEIRSHKEVINRAFEAGYKETILKSFK